MLTMTELKGVTLSQMKEFPSHIDRKQLAHSTVRFFVEGMFFHGIFHCDAHAGNLIVDASGEGRVGIVDFGMVGRLSESLKERLSRLFMALASQDFQGMAITYGELAEFGKRLSVREFQNDLEHLFAPNISRSLSEVDMGEMMLESLAIAQKHRIRLPRDLILFFRAVVTLEHVGRSLDPDFKFSEFGQSFSKELLRRQFSVQSISRDLLRAVEGLRLLPSALRTLAHRIDQDELFPSSEGLESAIEGFKQSQKLIALAIVFFGSLFSAVLMSVLNAGHWSEIPLFAISGLCFLGLLNKYFKG
jgi:ubiquinone biosynthesis protein